MEKFRTYKLAIQFYHKANHLILKGPMKNQIQRALLSMHPEFMDKEFLKVVNDWNN